MNLENYPVSIIHDSDVLFAHKQAFIQIDYFKTLFLNDKNNECEYYVKIGFPQPNVSKSPVIPILTIEEDYNNDENDPNFTNESIHTEWIWMLIKKWEGNKILGILSNDPAFRKDLSKGMEIEFIQKAIMDWVIIKNGEEIEGNFLHKILLTKGKPVD